MKRFIFNPQHDLCLASGESRFIPPASALAFQERCRWIERFMGRPGEDNPTVIQIVPWGWNRVLKDNLLKEGVSRELIPSDEELEFIKTSSRRELALMLLEYVCRTLQMSGTEGAGFVENTLVPASYRIVAVGLDEIGEFLHCRGKVVLKAPLSGSGKGVRFVSGELMETDRGWCRRVLKGQGAVIVEQRLDVVQEFAMLFEVTGGGVDGPAVVSFRGYSLFYAVNGAYKGNLLASNEHIEGILGEYVPVEQLRKVRYVMESFLQHKLGGKYRGFVGVDQFICKADGKYLLNPAVEINLRMTMGLIARNIYDFHAEEHSLGEGTHFFEPEKGIIKNNGE